MRTEGYGIRSSVTNTHRTKKNMHRVCYFMFLGYIVFVLITEETYQMARTNPVPTNQKSYDVMDGR